MICAQEKGLSYTGIAPFVDFVRQIAEKAKIPVALQLDHGANMKLVEACLRAGFSGVMLNTAHLNLEENIARTRQLALLAKSYHASVEGELGLIEGDEDGRDIEPGMQSLTKAGDVNRFTSETGIAALAVSVNTVHYKRDKLIEPDFGLIREIRQATQTPLVLHGGASVNDALVVKLVSAGFRKYNINFAINFALLDSLKSQLNAHSFRGANGKYRAPVAKFFREAGDAVGNVMEHWADLLSSRGKW